MTDESSSTNNNFIEKQKTAFEEGWAFFSASPEVRARAAGRYLSRLALTWGVLSVLGSIVMMLRTECIDRSEYGTCWESTHPYVNWAIVSLLANLIVASFMYAVGAYIEARMSKVIAE